MVFIFRNKILKIIVFKQSLGIGLTYYTVNVSLQLVATTYGFMVGFGSGLAYIGPLAIVMKV